MHLFAIMFDMILFRRGIGVYVTAFAVFLLMVLVSFYLAMSNGKGNYGLRAFSDDIAMMVGTKSRDTRPSLTGMLPPVPPGWTRRDYLRADGDVIVAETAALGRTARLRAGGDLERFGVFASGGGNQTARVYVQGDLRIAIGVRRPPQLLAPNGAAFAAVVLITEAPFEAEIGLETDGVVFYRRGRALPETAAPMPYDVYRADAAGGLVIELFTNAPDAVVEALLPRFDLDLR